MLSTEWGWSWGVWRRIVECWRRQSTRVGGHLSWGYSVRWLPGNCGRWNFRGWTSNERRRPHSVWTDSGSVWVGYRLLDRAQAGGGWSHCDYVSLGQGHDTCRSGRWSQASSGSALLGWGNWDWGCSTRSIDRDSRRTSTSQRACSMCKNWNMRLCRCCVWTEIALEEEQVSWKERQTWGRGKLEEWRKWTSFRRGWKTTLLLFRCIKRLTI